MLLAQGDGSALAGIVAAYKDRLVNFFYRNTGDRHISEDLAQEVFVRVFRKAETFQGGLPFEPWLFTIARNLVVDHIRRACRRGKTSSLPSGDKATSGDEPPRTLERKELGEIVRTEVRRLPEKMRSAFVLCEMEGNSYEAAGEILGVPAKTVGSRLAKAREHLRGRMEKYRF